MSDTFFRVISLDSWFSQISFKRTKQDQNQLHFTDRSLSNELNTSKLKGVTGNVR